MVVDRLKAYQAVDKVKGGLIMLAFCWARSRDFWRRREWPDQEAWALGWVERISSCTNSMMHVWRFRRQRPPSRRPTGVPIAAVTALGRAARRSWQRRPSPGARKVLESLGNRWNGLTVFVERPEVPMDNNTAERSERRQVVGRKNYYGSGSLWSGRLAAMMFSLFQALPVGPEPATVADRLPGSLRPGRRPRSRRRGPVPAMEPQPGAKAGVGM